MTEISFGAIAICSSIVLAATTAVTEGTMAHTWLLRIDRAFWVLFCAEYVLRLIASPQPLRYIRSFFGIVDLLAVLSGILAINALGSVKPLRVLRVARVLKLARYSAAVDRFSEAYDDIKNELALFSGITAVMTFIASYAIWEFEHETNEAYGNLFECVYWSVASLTMGAEGIAPMTVAGKVLAMLLVLIGLSIVAVPSGLFASALSRTGRLRLSRTGEPPIAKPTPEIHDGSNQP